MIPRHRLLQAPHMETLRDHPALDAMPDRELRALEAFMGFCAEHHISDPGGADIRAFFRLHDEVLDTLQDLHNALQRLGLGNELLDDIETIHVSMGHKTNFRGITKGRSRDYQRRVSVKVEDLPMAWQKTLRRLRTEEEYSLSILNRMEARLGWFAWSAQHAGHPVDLADTDALRALYDDVRARSIKRQRDQARKKGLVDDTDTPRWATLRSTWEELRRFAEHHGSPAEVLDQINLTYGNVTKREASQPALKLVKAKEAGTRLKLLKKAEAMLVAAETLSLPQMRHARRNLATAIALGCVVPARPGDVLAHHVLGVGIVFEPVRNGYRFTYKASKTAGSTGVDIDIPLLPWWNKFIDALILQDDDPRYLGQLRAQALARKRQLYVQYDGTPAVYDWYGRVWTIVAKTGGHIARSLIYDDPSAAGIRYASVSNGHKLGGAVVRKYETEALCTKRILDAQATMAALFGDTNVEDEDER
tara:strand:- start:12023 stop:13450 length:1428 start_codon:yes stop_codon:yes gene_type:complete